MGAAEILAGFITRYTLQKITRNPVYYFSMRGRRRTIQFNPRRTAHPAMVFGSDINLLLTIFGRHLPKKNGITVKLLSKSGKKQVY